MQIEKHISLKLNGTETDALKKLLGELSHDDKKKFCGSQPQQNPARINGCSTSSADLMSAMGKKFAPILVSQNQTKPARVVWGVQTSPDYVAWCGSKGYAESFLKKVIFGQSGETAPGAAGAQMQGHARDMASQQTKQPNDQS